MKRFHFQKFASISTLVSAVALTGCNSLENNLGDYFRLQSGGSNSLTDPGGPGQSGDPGEPGPGPSNPAPGPSNPAPGPSNPAPGPSNPAPGPSNPAPGPSGTPNPCTAVGVCPGGSPTPPAPTPSPTASPEVCNVVAACTLGAASRFDVKHCPVSGQMRYEFHFQVPAQPAHQIIGYRGLPNSWSPNARMWTSLVPGAPNPQKRFVLTTEVDRSDANQRFVGEVTGEYPCAGPQDLPADLAADRKHFANGLCAINVSAVSCRDSGIFTHTPGDMSLLPE